MSPFSARQQRLRQLADVLLDEEASMPLLDDAAGELYELFASIAGEHLLADQDGTVLPSGAALSPANAASCTRDSLRTAMFLRGIHAAIVNATRRFSGMPIEVVYAGTGPFASLIIPLLPGLAKSDIRLTLIDIHESSIAAVVAILKYFGLEGFLRNAFVTDATAYQHSAGVGVPIHIVIVEGLQRALTVEPQVAIVRQLVPQLAPGGILIPEEITVDFVFVEPSSLRTCINAGRVMSLNASTALSMTQPAMLMMPPHSAHMLPAYATGITVFGRHTLREGDSGLTQPAVAWDIRELTEGEWLSFQYATGAIPGIKWKRLATFPAAIDKRDAEAGKRELFQKS